MHTCPNNKVYIGITGQVPTKRWGNGTKYINNNHFCNAIKKYGWENIKHEILYQNLTKEEAESKEIELIKKYKSNDSKFGYNKSTGGEIASLGCKRSKETKIKLSLSNKGKKRTKKQCDNIKQMCRQKNGKSVISYEENFIDLGCCFVERCSYRKYNSIGQASEKTGISKNTIRQSCKYKRRGNNRSWRYYIPNADRYYYSGKYDDINVPFINEQK